MPSDSEDERPPRNLLQPLSHFQSPQDNLNPSAMSASDGNLVNKPCQIRFSTRDEEIAYTAKIMDNCTIYDGNPETLSAWLRATSAFLVRERYPERDHPFIIRHILTDEALDYYLAHDDIVFNFCDLRKLLLIKYGSITHLRTLSSLDSITTLTLNAVPSVLTSTQNPATTAGTENHSTTATTFSFAQSLEDLTQHDIRKTIIEDLHRNYQKFSGDNRQDVIKWLKILENKFETAGIPDVKKFDLISQLLEKGAFDWFHEHKATFNHSWTEFVAQFKETFDSPTRVRIAMQKLTAYAQSPNQDIRSFCSEMRKLFEEADSQMSPVMKLEFLLAKVKPSYRLDLLKQKPKNIAEFETLAKDLESTYLVYEAIEQNLPSNPSLVAPVPSPYSGGLSPSYNPRYSDPSYNQYSNRPRYSASPRYGARLSSTTTPSFRTPTSFPLDSRYRAPTAPRFPSQRFASQRFASPRFPSQPFNAARQPSAGPVQPVFALPPALLSDTSLPDVGLRPASMSTTTPSQFPSSQLPSLLSPSLNSSSAPVICQFCHTSSHSSSDCPFQ